jgi:hypothetical protein
MASARQPTPAARSPAWVRAELLVREDFAYRVVDHDSQAIRLGETVYLPVVFRSD